MYKYVAGALYMYVQHLTAHTFYSGIVDYIYYIALFSEMYVYCVYHKFTILLI